jgi:hypothetical protein
MLARTGGRFSRLPKARARYGARLRRSSPVVIQIVGSDDCPLDHGELVNILRAGSKGFGVTHD